MSVNNTPWNRLVLAILLVSLFTHSGTFAQPYICYSSDSLRLQSAHLGESIEIPLLIPETLPYAASTTRYPVIIVFDSQNKSTFKSILNSIDMLGNESQMPECIVAGIPFTRFNRMLFTSGNKREGDSVMGMTHMEDFLFDELLPLLSSDYKAGDFLVMMGHSRTAYLVNYLCTRHSREIDVAVALSGFYDNEPLSQQLFRSYITEASNFPYKLRYYFTAGSSVEEEPYLTEYQMLNEFIEDPSSDLPKNFIPNFSVTPHANHITNYWVSVPPILLDCFAAYSEILNTWLHHKLQQGKPIDPVEEFRSDLTKAGSELGFTPNPDLTQIFSLASLYSGQETDPLTAAGFIAYGLEYYPGHPDLLLQEIAFYEEAGETDQANQLKQKLLDDLATRTDLSEEEIAEIRSYLQE